METRSRPGTDELAIPEHEEQRRLGRRVVDTGRGLRIHQTVAAHPHQAGQTLLHDALDVQHVPIGQSPSTGTAAAMPRRSTSVTVTPFDDGSATRTT